MQKMNIKKVFLTVIISLTVFLCVFGIIQKNDELIIQGEIDTKDVTLSPKITGRIQNITVKEGDVVNAGDTLIQLDIPDILAQQKQAEAAYVLAEKKYNREKVLREEGYISAQTLDEVTSVLQQTENKLKEVNSYVDERTIVAPISGQVKEISVEEGELVSAGSPIITMIDTTDSWVVFNLREDLLTKIKLGSIIDVNIPAIGKESIPVKVDYISAMGNYTTWRATKVRGDFDLKTFEIHARPVNKVDGLIAGMSVITDWNKIKK